MAANSTTTKHPPMAPGQRYGRLVTIEFVDRPYKYMTRWKFRCDCGNEHIAWAAHVRHGSTKSCGCLVAEVSSVTARLTLTTHGKSKTSEFKIWCGMRRRCQDQRDKHFMDYGGRGIKVCERWREVQNFVADMSPRPAGMTLDRIRNDGDYEPGNCRWANYLTQARNRPQAKLNDEQRSRAIDLYAQNRSPKKTAKLIGIKSGDVKNIVYGDSRRRITSQAR